MNKQQESTSSNFDIMPEKNITRHLQKNLSKDSENSPSLNEEIKADINIGNCDIDLSEALVDETAISISNGDIVLSEALVDETAISISDGETVEFFDESGNKHLGTVIKIVPNDDNSNSADLFAGNTFL